MTDRWMVGRKTNLVSIERPVVECILDEGTVGLFGWQPRHHHTVYAGGQGLDSWRGVGYCVEGEGRKFKLVRHKGRII